VIDNANTEWCGIHTYIQSFGNITEVPFLQYEIITITALCLNLDNDFHSLLRSKRNDERGREWR